MATIDVFFREDSAGEKDWAYWRYNTSGKKHPYGSIRKWLDERKITYQPHNVWGSMGYLMINGTNKQKMEFRLTFL